MQPPSPRNARFSNVKETFVYVEWEHPDLYQYFSIRSYYIKYREYGKNTWFNKSQSTVIGTEMQLDGLESDTKYTIKVIAKNDYGLGKESDGIQVKTLKAKGICIIHSETLKRYFFTLFLLVKHVYAS